MISYCEFKQYLWIWWNVANTVVVRRCMSLSSAQALYTLLCKPARAITAAVRVFCAIVHSTCGFAGDFIPLSKNLQSISLVMASCPRKRNYIRGFLKCGYPKKWMIWVPQKQQSPNLRWQLRLWTWISLQRNQD